MKQMQGGEFYAPPPEAVTWSTEEEKLLALVRLIF